MSQQAKIVAIIPARGGSKGIPRKNVRLLRNKPLVSYVIEAALKSKCISKVVVTTEDAEIAEISKIYGAEVIKRPVKLADDEIPLDPVVFHALKKVEAKENQTYDLVITIQPTSPLLSTKTIDEAIEIMSTKDYDTLISVVNETHLYWIKKGNNLEPIYTERRNRQYLDPIFRETGSLLISKRSIVVRGSRIGKKIFLFEVPDEEGIDIDTDKDWWIAENTLSKRKIVFRVDADHKIGLGHVYRAVTLANRLFGHEIVFLMNNSKKLGIKKVTENNYPMVGFRNQEDFFEKVEQIKPDIMINDVLDTPKEYILELKKLGMFVVNFEDLGFGADLADIVINALYENSNPPENHYYGYMYECLRDGFYLYPKKKVRKRVEHILITFGGVDENNLTLRTLKAFDKLNLRELNVVVVLGLGYSFKNDLRDSIESMRKLGFKIRIEENVRSMAKYIYKSDLVITSNGRTIYEVAAIGTPCISISQNEREVTHLFSRVSRGIVNLGIAFNVSEDDIAASLKRIVEDYKLRERMNVNLLKYDLLHGTERVVELIFEKYREWERNEN